MRLPAGSSLTVARGWELFRNRGTGRANLNGGGMNVDRAWNWGVIDVAAGLGITRTLFNKGAIRVSHDSSVSGTVIGRQPIQVPHDAAPSVIWTYPSDGAADVRRGATVVVAFSEPTTAIRSWYLVYWHVPGEGSVHRIAARAYRISPTKYAIDPVGQLPAGREITARLYPDLVLDKDRVDPPSSMTNYDFAVRFTTAP